MLRELGELRLPFLLAAGFGFERGHRFGYCGRCFNFGITYNTKMSLPIVIDTNVMVAALKSRDGASFKLVMALTTGAYRPCLSVPLFIEYEAVLKRTDLVSSLSSQDLDDFLDYFLSQSSIHEVFFLWRPFLKDPKDDLVLEAAVASQSKYLVTFNLRDFTDVDKYFGIRVVTPQQFLLEQKLL